MTGNSTIFAGEVCPTCPDGTHCSCTAIGQRFKPGEEEGVCGCGVLCKCKPCTCNHKVNVGVGKPPACHCGNGCHCICTTCVDPM